MTIVTQDDLRAALHPGDRLMALDVGAKTIGLASAVWGQDLVMPLQTIARTKFTRDATALVAVMSDLGVRALVVGWPLLPDGTLGKRCQSVRDFTDELMRFLETCHPGQAATAARPGTFSGLNPMKVSDRPLGVRDDTPPILITFQDERFSTAHGDEMVDNIGKTAGKRVTTNRRDLMIDALAAQRILTEFMEG